MMQIPQTSVLKTIYGETKESSQRFESLYQGFEKSFGEKEVEFFSAPGRTEIIGNHTDHNGGKILAASIDMDTIGAACPTDTNTIEIISEGYRDKIIVNLDRLESVPKNRGTVSLVAGIAEAAKKFGYQVSGFQAYISTQVISSAGVSSSASFEMLICSMIDYFFNQEKIDVTDYARIGQYAENKYWSKASGLMDQMACAVGGSILLDFSRGIRYEKKEFQFETFGYRMVIVNTGKSHADLSEEYSEVPLEMKKIASLLGKETLSQCSLDQLLFKLPEIEKKAKNDRAVLRAIHFFEENRRVEEMAEAISKTDGQAILKLLEESGRSSWELLQNCYSLSNFKEQKVTLCLALTELFLRKIKDGCCRVHGGGFAGVMMCVVPEAFTEEYVRYMERYVGAGNVYPMRIRNAGAVHLAR